MRRKSYLVLTFIAFVSVTDLALATETLQCDVGPLTKTYGNSKWLVYSCSDKQTLVFVSAPGSPAMPFYFRMSPNGQLVGEGTGSKAATDAAYGELSGMADADRRGLIEQTQQAAAH